MHMVGYLRLYKTITIHYDVSFYSCWVGASLVFDDLVLLDKDASELYAKLFFFMTRGMAWPSMGLWNVTHDNPAVWARR